MLVESSHSYGSYEPKCWKCKGVMTDYDIRFHCTATNIEPAKVYPDTWKCAGCHQQEMRHFKR